jgi:uncharacterized protein YqhQ
MKNDKAVDPSVIVEKYLKGMKGFFPFIERISKKKPSQLLAFLKCVIVIFSLVGFTLFIILSCSLSFFTGFKSGDFIPIFLTTIFVLIMFTISTVFISHRLKIKES